MRVERGGTRLVLVTRRWVFKVPTPKSWRAFLWGLISNMNEAGVWEDSKGDERLCPLLFSMPGGWLNVMAYAKPVGASQIDFDRFDTLDDDVCLSADLHPDNFGEYEGRIVLVDYA